MNNVQLSVLCLVITLGIYFANKRLYRRFRKLPLMPLVLTPALLVLMLVFGHISWQNYIGESHWLLWLLGPATIAFAVPVYDNLAIIKRHWMSLTAGVVTATVVAVTSSVCAGGGRTPGRAARSGGAVRGRHWRVWHGGRRRAIFASLYPGRHGKRGRIRRGVTWGGHGAFL